MVLQRLRKGILPHPAVFLQVLSKRKRRNSGAAHECFSHEASHQSKAKRSGQKVKCRSRCGESVLESRGFDFGRTEWLLGAGRSREERGLTAGPGPALPAHPGSSLGRFVPVEALCHSTAAGPGRAALWLFRAHVQSGEQRLFLSGSLGTQKS